MAVTGKFDKEASSSTPFATVTPLPDPNDVSVAHGQALVPYENNTAMVPYNNNSSNAVPSAIHPKRKKMKKQRKRRQAGAAVGGAIVGGVVLGPLGAVVGGAGSYVVTRKICKAGERRAQRRHERDQVQQAADSSVAANSGSFA